MSRLGLALAAALLLLTGCTSSSSDDEPSGADGGDGGGGASSDSGGSTTTGPDCAEVWKAGETLPDDYTGCVTKGAAGRQDIVTCEDGSSLVTYVDLFYAVTGGTIAKPDVAPLQDTEEFGKAYVECTGG